MEILRTSIVSINDLKIPCVIFGMHHAYTGDGHHRVVGAIAIFTYHQPQLSRSLSDPVGVAKLLFKWHVITKDEVASVEAARSSSSKCELLLNAVRKVLENGKYKGIRYFGEVLYKVPGNEKLGKAICDNYSKFSA